LESKNLVKNNGGSLSIHILKKKKKRGWVKDGYEEEK
jgi:hypothetical protein